MNWRIRPHVLSNTLLFLALVFTALLLAPAVAHLASLPNKIAMSEQDYYAAQQVYRGWAMFGVAFSLALVADFWLAMVQRFARLPFYPIVAAFICIAAAMALFFGLVYPANVATENWTVAPANWADLRTRWEYGHAAGAVLIFVAFCLTAFAAVVHRSDRAALPSC